jgi:hypothetical protein
MDISASRGNVAEFSENRNSMIELDSVDMSRPVYVKIWTKDPLYVNASLQTLHKYLHVESRLNLINGIILGIVFSIVLFGLINALIIKSRLFLYYAGIFFLVGILYMINFGYAALWQPESVFFRRFTIETIGHLVLIFQFLFLIDFLDLKKNLPLFDRIFSVIIIVLSISYVFHVGDIFFITHEPFSQLIGIAYLFVLITVLYAAYRKVQGALIYLTAFSAVIFSATIYLLGWFDRFQPYTSFLLKSSIIYGFITEAFILGAHVSVRAWSYKVKSEAAWWELNVE